MPARKKSIFKPVIKELLFIVGLLGLIGSAAFVLLSLILKPWLEPNIYTYLFEIVILMLGLVVGVHLLNKYVGAVMNTLGKTKSGRRIKTVYKKHRSFRVTSKVTATIFLVVILHFGIASIITGVLGTDTPFYAVRSNSMKPAFERGDLLVIYGASPAEIRVGDVIVYYSPQLGATITHRVVEIIPHNHSYLFVTKGDANPHPDPQPVTAEFVKGRVIHVIPKIGYLALLWHSQ